MKNIRWKNVEEYINWFPRATGVNWNKRKEKGILAFHGIGKDSLPVFNKALGEKRR